MPAPASDWNSSNQPSLYCECGPPWMYSATGFFLFGSKLYGFISHASIPSPPTDLYVKRSASAQPTSEFSLSLNEVNLVSLPVFTLVTKTSVGCVTSVET